MSLPVKDFWKSVNIWRSYGQEFGVLFFDSQCISLALWSKVFCASASTLCNLLPNNSEQTELVSTLDVH